MFSGQTLRPRIFEQPQRRGRPKNSWGSKVYKLATAVVGGADLDEALFSNLKQGKILAILLFRTAPIERLCAMPMRH